MCCSAWVEVVLGESIHRAHGCCPCWQGGAEFPGSIPEDGFVGQKHKPCARPEDCAVAVPPFQAGIRSGWGVHPCHHPGAQLWGTKPPRSAAQVGSRRPGGSCGHGQKVLKEMLEVAVWAGLRNHSTAPVPAQASPHNPHLCRAPSLSSFRRIQAEHFGSFSCFFSSLLPAGADLSLRLAELHPRGTCFAFVVHETAINYWLLCVSQSLTQPIKPSGHVIVLEPGSGLLVVSWHRPRGRGRSSRDVLFSNVTPPALFLKSPTGFMSPWSPEGRALSLLSLVFLESHSLLQLCRGWCRGWCQILVSGAQGQDEEQRP